MKKMVKVILAAAAVVALAVPAMGAVGDTKLIVKDDAGTADVFKIQNNGYGGTTGKFAAGTLSPLNTITVVDQATTATRGLGAIQATSDAAAAMIDFRKMRGSYTTTPTTANTVLNGDFIGAFHGYGVDTAGAWQRGATINYYVDAAPGAGTVPVALIFATGDNDRGAGTNFKIPRFVVGSTGKLSIGNGYVPLTSTVVMAQTTGANLLDINSDAIRLRISRVPATSTAACYTGEIAWGPSYIYVCTSGNGTTGTWMRSALSAF